MQPRYRGPGLRGYRGDHGRTGRAFAPLAEGQVWIVRHRSATDIRTLGVTNKSPPQLMSVSDGP